MIPEYRFILLHTLQRKRTPKKYEKLDDEIAEKETEMTKSLGSGVGFWQLSEERTQLKEANWRWLIFDQRWFTPSKSKRPKQFFMLRFQRTLQLQLSLASKCFQKSQSRKKQMLTEYSGRKSFLGSPTETNRRLVQVPLKPNKGVADNCMMSVRVSGARPSWGITK